MQSEQSIPSAPVYPARHVQSFNSSLAARELEFNGHTEQIFVTIPTRVEYRPAGQFVHATSPTDVLNLPATHSVQVPPGIPLQPALQAHLLIPSLPSGDVFCVMHSWHTMMDIAFNTVEYLPATQAVHAAGPESALNVPLAHAEHVPPFSPLHPALQSRPYL